MADYLHIQLDGNEVAVEPGTTVLQAILGTGQDHPHICYHPALGPIETCDTCIAEVNGSLVRACSTPVTDGLVVRTHSVGADSPVKKRWTGSYITTNCTAPCVTTTTATASCTTRPCR